MRAISVRGLGAAAVVAHLIAVQCSSGGETGVEEFLETNDENKDGAIDLAELEEYIEKLTGKASELCEPAQEIMRMSGVTPGQVANETNQIQALLANLYPCVAKLATAASVNVSLGDDLFFCTMKDSLHDHDHDHEGHSRRRLGGGHDDHDDHGHGHGHDEDEQVPEIAFGSKQFQCELQEEPEETTAHVTGEVVGFTLLAVTLVTLLAISGMIGLVVCGLTEIKFMHEITAFAAGVIQGLVVLHLYPESVELVGSGKSWRVPATFLAGLFSGMVNHLLLCGSAHEHELQEMKRSLQDVERAKVHTQDEQELDAKAAPKATDQALVMNVIFGDVFCNLIDGVLIATAFMLDIPSGWLVTLSVCLHELPQEFTDFYLLLEAGLSVKRAALANLLGASSSIFGAGIMLAVGSSLTEAAQGFILAFGSGVLLYAALAQLMPRILRDHPENAKTKVIRIVLVLLGMVLLGLTQLFHYHPGDDHDHHNH